MTITVKIIEDSKNETGQRLTTMQLRYPRFIHAEFMTHRLFSRNASSSRAIPVKKMIEDLKKDPAMPVYWGSHKPGMQAGDELDETELEIVKDQWLSSMNSAIKSAQTMIHYGLHKQIANRILEPWSHINVIVSSTEWDNFYNLRNHPDAQPEICELAKAMQKAQAESQPELLQPGQWHLPYVDRKTWDNITNTTAAWLEVAKMVSVARCARVSYLTHDGRETTIEEDIALYHRLVESTPIHASPTEHQATPMENINNGNSVYNKPVFKNRHLGGNFNGWIQNRKLIE